MGFFKKNNKRGYAQAKGGNIDRDGATDVEFIDVASNKPSKVAINRSQKRNEKLFTNTQADALYQFLKIDNNDLTDNQSAIISRFDNIIQTLEKHKDSKNYTKILAEKLPELRRIATIFVATLVKSGKASQINTTALGSRAKISTPEALQQEINTERNINKSAMSKVLHAGRSIAWDTPAHGVKAIGHIMATPLTAIVIPIGDIYSAAMIKSKFSVAQRQTIAGTGIAACIAATTLPLFSGDSFAHTFTQDSLSADNVHAACLANPIVKEHGPIVAAFAVAHYDPSNAPKDVAYLAALAALKVGANPIAALAISAKETWYWKDVDARSESNTANTATGLFQTTDPTMLDWLTNNVDRLDYGENKSVERSIRAFVKDIQELGPDTILKQIQNNYSKPQHWQIAINASYSPEIAGQLFGFESLKTTPEMSVSYLNDQGIDSIKTVLGLRYQPHLLGPSGDDFLKHLVQHAPDVNMWDPKELKAVYEQYRGSDAARGTGRFDAQSYFSSRADNNPGVFKQRHNLSAQTYADMIASFAASADIEERIIDPVREQLANGATVDEICAKDPLLVRKAIPEKTSLVNVVWTQATTPSERQWIATQTDVAFNMASSLWNKTEQLFENDKNSSGLPRPVERPAQNFTDDQGAPMPIENPARTLNELIAEIS